jgi:hypothetical protein
MANSSKNYPKAVPCHSPEELTAQNSRLNQLNEELATQTKRLTQSNEELTRSAARFRRWTLGLLSVCAGLLVLCGVSMAIAFLPPKSAPSAAVSSNAAMPVVSDNKNAMPAIIAAKVAPTELPANAIAKPDTATIGYLEALGGLSATHLYQSHLNIGLLADGVESETYSVAEADKNLKTVVAMMKLVDGQLAKVTKTGLDPDDQESLRQIQAVAGLLHTQADALRAYWANGDKTQADRYHAARTAASAGLNKVMGRD